MGTPGLAAGRVWPWVEAMRVELRLLGPVEAVRDGRGLPLRGTKQRTVLAVLALQAGRAVPVRRLMDTVWGHDPPRTAHQQVLNAVSELRHLLGAAVVTRPSGYMLDPELASIDLSLFQAECAEAREVALEGHAADAARLLRAGLARWRGPALGGTVGLEAEQARLEEQRLAVLEQRIELDLALGCHTEVAAELAAMVGEHPLRERLRALLMLALYRCGRQADALEVYRDTRRRLADDLGIEPSAELQRLERAILAADPGLDLGSPRPAGQAARGRPGAPPVPPAQLPADVAEFTGRARFLRRLDELLGGDSGTGPGTVVLSAIAGTAGVGKSALAVHAAHRLADLFPDGQLYVDLRGATPGLEPLPPIEALGRFLRALGAEPASVPGDVDEAAAQFRSHVAGRRLLLVLDDARDAAQVRPLLPASASCGVLITSRRMLASLGGTQLHLDVLSTEEAITLLGRLAGEDRVAAEPEAAGRIVGWCGHLPLAVRIAGARLATRPGWPLSALAERLADAQRRLDELALADLGVRASFEVSYRDLEVGGDPTDRAAADAFALLGLPDGPDLGLPAAARLLDEPDARAERVLERLVDAGLLETPVPGRYRLHDLLRLYARELADDRCPGPAQAAALTRVFGWYAATAWRTAALLRPADPRLARADGCVARGGLDFDDAPAALGWLEGERANLTAAIAQAAATPDIPGVLATQLAHALFAFLYLRNYMRDWVAVNQLAVAVAERAGDRVAHAQANNDLGVAYWRLGRYDEALACHRQSLASKRQLGDRHGEAASLGNLGAVYMRQGRYDEATGCMRESVAISRELGDRHGHTTGLGNLGAVLERQGRYDEALDCLQEALAIGRELGDRHCQAANLSNLAIVNVRLARYDEALACLQESLPLFRQVGSREGEAEVLMNLGTVHARQGRYEQALAPLRESLAIRRDIGDPHGLAETLRELGTTLVATGRRQEAAAHWREALALFEQVQSADADPLRALLTSPPVAP